MSEERGTHFIAARIDADLEAGTYGGRVATRFPPEPNGYLHIGHAKAICLNFGLAKQYGGTCNLRFDDTNPEAEDTVYVESILADVRWLGFEPSEVLYTSGYFEQLYAWAELLVSRGLAYVDDESLEQMRAHRGTVNEPGTPSAGRARSIEHNLELLRRMRKGDFEDGAMVLRARIDLAHPNMKMRDPLMYRIRHAHHHRTGDAWCIYPMYDWAHGQSDAVERITHSICTLEFENNRELYDWFLDALGAETLGTEAVPHQHEFARLALNYTVMSKRKLRLLVEQGHVDGWDDPRLPTIAGMRRRGVSPEALRTFAERVGVAKANSTVDLGLFEFTIRDDLNHKARRRMAVLEPLAVELTGLEGAMDLTAPDFPSDVGLPGERVVPLGRHIVIERGDFAVDPPKGFRRLVPGGEVRLRYGHVIRCDEVLTDGGGAVTGLRCSVDTATLGRNPTDRKVAGTIHWAPADGPELEVRVFDRLFAHPSPGSEGDFLEDLNPNSLTTLRARVEPALAALKPGEHVQLERQGYFFADPIASTAGAPVLNRVVALKDSWTKAAPPEAVASKDEAMSGEEAAAHNDAVRAEQEAGFLEENPKLAAHFERLVAAGARREEVLTVLRSDTLRGLMVSALGWQGGHIYETGVVSWLVHGVGAALKDRDAHALTGEALAELVQLVEGGSISSKTGRKVLVLLLDEGGSAEAIVTDRGWVKITDAAKLAVHVRAAFAAMPREAARLKAGEGKLTGVFVGAVMRSTKGAADPKVLQRVLRSELAQL